MLSACNQSAPAAESPDVRQWVVSDLADQLGPGGRFQVRPPAGEHHRIITPEQAVRLATAFVHGFRSYKDLPRGLHGERLSHMDKAHGDVIDFQALRPGSQVYFPATPYGPLADSVPELIREAYGPHYIIPFHDPQGTQVLVVAVPAEDLGYWIDERGRVRPPGGTGGIRIYSTIVSASAEYPVPLTPECAVRLVGQATGRRVLRVPEAVYPGRPWAPTILYWQLTLDAPVQVRLEEQGNTGTTQVLYLGLEARSRSEPGRLQPVLFQAAPEQPRADTVEAPVAHRGNRPTGETDRRVFVVPIRPGRAVRFQKVQLLNGSVVPPVRHLPCQAAVEGATE